MIESLEIKNYRNLKHLTLHKLGRINLFVGKNNTGKTSVLEAISIYSKKGSLQWILQLLEDRGEYNRRTDNFRNDQTEYNISVLKNLFYKRNIGNPIFEQIYINPLESDKDNIFLSFIWFYDKIESLEVGKRRERIMNLEMIDENYLLGFRLISSGIPQIRPLSASMRQMIINSETSSIVNNVQFVRTANIDRDINSELWDSIALSNKEEDVTNALGIIEPNLERISFIGQGNERTAVALIKNEELRIPLKSMGDGINRILTIILAMVNCENGILLIDEFENGLHYSVQESLWEVIFATAYKLNLQVFVTTHSNDCINAFSRVMERFPEYSDGRMIRLDNKNGEISAKEFEASKLQIADENGIELR